MAAPQPDAAKDRGNGGRVVLAKIEVEHLSLVLHVTVEGQR